MNNLYDQAFYLRILTSKQEYGAEDKLHRADLDPDLDLFNEKDGTKVAKDTTNNHDDQADNVVRFVGAVRSSSIYFDMKF